MKYERGYEKKLNLLGFILDIMKKAPRKDKKNPFFIG